MSRLAAKIHSLLQRPEENLEGLLKQLQSRHERPRPRPWSRLFLEPKEEPEAIALFPEIASVLAPLVGSDDSIQRHGALQALGMLRSTEARTALLLGLADPLSICRVAALDGLAACPPSPEVVDRVIALLEDDKQSVRLHAASALGLLGDERAIAPLQSLVADGKKEARIVKQWAAFSLAEFGKEAEGGPPDDPEDPEEEEAIQREAAERVAEGITDLLSKLKGKDNVTMGDFVTGLEAMEQQFDAQAEAESSEEGD